MTQSWYDSAGRDKLWPSAAAVSTDHARANFAIDGQRVGSEYWSGGPGATLRLDLTWPGSRGTVATAVSRSEVHFRWSNNVTFDIQASADGGSTWVTAVAAAAAPGGDRSSKTFDFGLTQATHLRLVARTGTLRVEEIDVWGAVSNPPGGWSHPTYNTFGELDQIAAKVAAGEQPWASAWNALVNDDRAKTSYTPTPPSDGSIDIVGGGNADQNNTRKDAAAAYFQALVWYIKKRNGVTNADAHAAKAVAIIQSYFNTLNGWSGSERLVGLVAAPLAQHWSAAVDLLENGHGGYADWTPGLRQDFRDFMQRHVIAKLAGISNQYTPDPWNNGPAFARAGQIAYAVLTEDRYNFDRMAELARRHIDRGITAWGQNTELGRDIQHMLAIWEGLIPTLEVAWRQGVDVYSHNSSRMLTALEYTADILNNTSGGVFNHAVTGNPRPQKNPFASPADTTPIGTAENPLMSANGTAFTGGVGRFTAYGFEMAYNHYFGRVGLNAAAAAPQLLRRYNATRPAGNDHTTSLSPTMPSTLTHGDVAARLGRAPAGHYRFDGDARDAAGGNDGTASGVTYAAGRVGQAARFNGAARVTVPHAAALASTGDLTVAAWVLIDAGSSGNRNILAKSFNDGYRLRIDANGRLDLILGTPGSSSIVRAVSTAAVPTGGWQHIAATVQFGTGGATVRFYINGVAAGSATLAITALEAGTGPLVIGASNTSGGEAFSGLLDDVRVYAAALTGSEILALPGFATLTAAVLPAAGSPAADTTLTRGELMPVAREAARRWAAAGADPRALASVRFVVADLPGGVLGLTLGTTVYIDRDAAGWGWFVDPTPRDDAEYAPGATPPAGVDLFTVVAQELGHALGLPEDGPYARTSVMYDSLAVGERRVPAPGDLASPAGYEPPGADAGPARMPARPAETAAADVFALWGVDLTPRDPLRRG